MMLAAPAQAATLEVLVTNLRNGRGNVRVAVCSQARFLGTDCEHVAQVPAKPGQVLVRVDGIEPGVWAVQAFQDENRNETLDRTFLGMPKEGLGFSRDAPFHFGPPRFSDAAVQIGPAGGRVTLALRYF